MDGMHFYLVELQTWRNIEDFGSIVRSALAAQMSIDHP